MAILLIVGWWLAARADHRAKTGAANNSSSPSYVNLNPPTQTEKKETEAHKDALAQNPPPPPAAPGGSRQVTPFITSASASTVKAYVSGVVEDGGTCTATFTSSDGTTKTFTSTGAANATNTICTPIQVSGLGAGSWSVVVSYSSTSSSGSSAAQTVKI